MRPGTFKVLYRLVLADTVQQDIRSDIKDSRTSVQYTRVKLRKLRHILDRTRTKLTRPIVGRRQTSIRRQNPSSRRSRKLSLRGSTQRPLKDYKRSSTKLYTNGGTPDVKILPRAEEKFRMSSDTSDTVVFDQK